MPSVLDCKNSPKHRERGRTIAKATGKQTSITEPINHVSRYPAAGTKSCNYFLPGTLAFLEVLGQDLWAARGHWENKKISVGLFFSVQRRPDLLATHVQK